MRYPKPVLLVAALAAALVAGVSAPAALADCVTDATVTYVGNDWGPVPMWRVSVPSLNATYDVQAAGADAARAAVAPFVTCPAVAPSAPPADSTPPASTPPAATAPADPNAPPGPSDLAVGQATQLAIEAVVTYVGNSWGPLPIWRVFIPSRNASYDVAAATADAARTAVVAAIATDIDRNPNAAPAAPAAPSQAPALAGATGDVVPVAAPAGTIVTTPAKSKTAKKGVHKAPATAKSKAR